MAKKKTKKKVVEKTVEKPKAYRGKRGSGIGKLVGTRVPMDVMDKLKEKDINISKAIREYLIALAS